MNEIDAPARRVAGRDNSATAGRGGANPGDIDRMATALAGGALALLGLRNVRDRLPLALLGGVILYHGLRGQGLATPALNATTAAVARPAHIEHKITINMAPSRLYSFWRDFRNLPIFMRHLAEVRVLDAKRSHWVARAPAGMRVEWDAEVFLEKPGELIAWRSLPASQVANAGSVRFRPGPGGRGTELRLVLEYVPPAGALGRAVARMFGEEPEIQVREDLERLKRVLEGGEPD